MTLTKYFTYLGENGSITSPVYLPNIYSICKVQIVADKGFILTNGTKQVKTITVPEREVNDWHEIPEQAK